MKNTCVACHESGRGCCFLTDNNTDYQIGISQYDIVKIKTYINQCEGYFIVKEVVTDEFRESLSKNIHPIFDKIFNNNVALRLKTMNGKCIFLKDDGCQLPNDIRPLYCKIYPFWLSADNKHIIVLSSFDCLAQRKSTLSWQVVNENFGYTEEYIRELFYKLETNLL